MRRTTRILVISVVFLVSLYVVWTGDLGFQYRKAERALLDQPLEAAEIDRIVAVMAMGNPAYGADSKTVTNPGEIAAFVDAFNQAVVGARVKDVDLAVAGASRYFFYRGDALIREFAFNGNDSERIWYGSGWHYVFYPGGRPFDLYLASEAHVTVVDEDLNEMERPR